jgi:hypothetical protein
MQEWFKEEACDGFMLVEAQPGQLRLFADTVAPILRARGLLRTDYPGTTLRENLGLPKPANLFAGAPSHQERW